MNCRTHLRVGDSLSTDNGYWIVIGSADSGTFMGKNISGSARKAKRHNKCNSEG